MTLALSLCWLLCCGGVTATPCGWSCFFTFAGADLPSFQTEAPGLR